MKRLALLLILTACAVFQTLRRSWLIRRGKRFHYIKLT